MINRALRYHKITADIHAEDREIVTEVKLNGKNGIILVVDGGLDFNPYSLFVLFALGQLWHDTNLDLLITECYAPGSSALNMIKHALSPLANMLTRVTLLIVLDGESKPPCLQKELSTEEHQEKEKLVFDQAIRVLKSYWDGKFFDGIPVSNKAYIVTTSCPLSKM